MAKLELSRSLPMPAGDAWLHVADLSSLGDWMTMHQGWRSELPDELTVGTTIVGVAGAKGMRNRVTWTIREFDPPSALAITGEGVGGTRYKLAMSVADTAIVPMQDLLGLHAAARMNRPGTAEGNWRWRMRPWAFSKEIVARLGALTETYGRAER